MSLQCVNVKQGNISHLSESEGCEFGLVFIFWTSGMQAVEAGMVAVAAGMVVKTAGANMCIHRSTAIQCNFGSGTFATCFVPFQVSGMLLSNLVHCKIGANVPHPRMSPLILAGDPRFGFVPFILCKILE